MAGLRRSRIQLKSRSELEAMRAAGALVARALGEVRAAAKAGVSTGELNEIADAVIRDAGAVPSFFGYQGFPAAICTSVNDEIVHGIPSRQRVLAAGDLLSVDCGAILDGWHGDSAVSIEVAEVPAEVHELSEATREVLQSGIAAVREGGRLTDISHALEQRTLELSDSHGRQYGIVEDFGGHGIGTEMHMEPFLANEGAAGKGPRLRAGMALAVEPMLTLGTTVGRELADGWTVVSSDGSMAAHWEHTVAVTAEGPWVLTAPAD